MESELHDFLERVNECTAAAVAESMPLVTQPIVSIDGLRSYLTEERLRRLLFYVGNSDLYEHAVRERYLAVFSILLSIDKAPYLPLFAQNDHMTDGGLPFLTCDAWPQMCKTIFDEFYEAQWKFCPKQLVYGQLHDKLLHRDMIVPFRSKVLLKDSVDSTVFKVELFDEYNHLIPVCQLHAHAWLQTCVAGN